MSFPRRAVTLVSVVMALSGCSTAAETQPIFALDEGSCFDTLETGRVALVRSCTEQHRFEVTGVVDLEGAEFPGGAALEQHAAEACPSLFVAFTHHEPATEQTVISQAFVPTHDAWEDAASRRIVCVAVPADGAPRSESVRGADVSAPPQTP